MQHWALISLETTTHDVEEALSEAITSPRAEDLHERSIEQIDAAKLAIRALVKKEAVPKGPITVHASGTWHNDPKRVPANTEGDYIAVTISRRSV